MQGVHRALAHVVVWLRSGASGSDLAPYNVTPIPQLVLLPVCIVQDLTPKREAQDEVTNKGSVAMDVCPHVRYRIDRDDRIAEVNDAWPKFATENDGDGLEPSRILSRSIWDFLADDTTIQLYKSMIRQLREGGLPMRFRFRCDAPDRRRLLAMEITSNLEGDVMFNVSSAVEQSRPYVSLLGHAGLHSGGLLVMCAWCKQIPLSTDRWVEAEEAVNALGLFSGSPLPALTHGICPSCFNAIEQVLENRELAAAGTVTCGALQVT